jgi:hypothetical protein
LVRNRRKKSDDLILWLDAGQDNAKNLPDTIEIWGDENEARFVYSVLQAVEWKWTPQQILEQEAALLHDVLTIGNADRVLKNLQAEQKNKPPDEAE